MTHYNNDNNEYCWAVNAKTFETMQHNTVSISALLYTRNPYSYSHFEIFICIYSARGEIHQISTNTYRYTTCCAANVYMFTYVFIGTSIVPLTLLFNLFLSNSISMHQSFALSIQVCSDWRMPFSGIHSGDWTAKNRC